MYPRGQEASGWRPSDSPSQDCPELPCPLRTLAARPRPSSASTTPPWTPAPSQLSSTSPRRPAPPRRPRRLRPRRCRVGDPARRLCRCARGRPAPRQPPGGQDCRPRASASALGHSVARRLPQSSMDSGSGSNRKGKRKAIGYGRDTK
ncbi:hypothetical protein PVAP13_2NG117803 [Panicum virgatum]|uniref:Uncharacterized protein n=1 Tax=Panicum virgatum TaxID=38727 RepID=A0A8T0VMJ5_PANVG|nr:hypothetical protein PVAP13_2NG117803 [Panicum virgatum]